MWTIIKIHGASPTFYVNQFEIFIRSHICNNLHDLALISDVANHRQLQIPDVMVFAFDIPFYEEAKCLAPLVDVPGVVANVFMNYSVITTLSHILC